MNDPEKNLRKSIIRELKKDFLCYEEVELIQPLFFGKKLRADIVIIPHDNCLEGHAIALELKSRGELFKRDMASTFQQASCYHLSIIRDNRLKSHSNARILAAFCGPVSIQDFFDRKDEKSCNMNGMLQLAQYWKVGILSRDTVEPDDGVTLSLNLGPVPQFITGRGWHNAWKGNLLGNRRFGFA